MSDVDDKSCIVNSAENSVIMKEVVDNDESKLLIDEGSSEAVRQCRPVRKKIFEKRKRFQKPRASRTAAQNKTAIDLSEDHIDDGDAIEKKPHLPRKRQDLTIGDKIKVLEMLESEQTPQGKIASLFRISQSQVSRILKNKAHIEEQCQKFANPARKRGRHGKAGGLERLLSAWYLEARRDDLPVSGPVLMEKAKSLGSDLGIDFKPTAGWLERWKKRNGITLKKVRDKDGIACPMKMGNHWRRYTLSKAVRDVLPTDVWVVDEPWLSYSALPDFAVAARGAGEPSNNRCHVTVITACNVTGTERRPLAVVGSPGGLGVIEQDLPIVYYPSPGGVISRDIFVAWLQTWDKELRGRKRKIVLLMGKTPYHVENVRVFNITQVFFPLETNAVLQPFRLGVTTTLKALYRHQLVQHVLSMAGAPAVTTGGWLNLGHPVPEISFIDATYMLHKAWKHLSPDTLVKGMVKAGLSKDVQSLNVDDIVTAPPGISQEAFESFVNLEEVAGDDTAAFVAVQYAGLEGTCGQYPGVLSLAESLADKNRFRQPPSVDEAVAACGVVRGYLQHCGMDLLDDFFRVQSCVQVHKILSLLSPESTKSPDPFHDSTSVHSLKMQAECLRRRVDKCLLVEIASEALGTESRPVLQLPPTNQVTLATPTFTEAQNQNSATYFTANPSHHITPSEHLSRQYMMSSHGDLCSSEGLRPECVLVGLDGVTPRIEMDQSSREGKLSFSSLVARDGRMDLHHNPASMAHLHAVMGEAGQSGRFEPRPNEQAMQYYSMANHALTYMHQK